MYRLGSFNTLYDDLNNTVYCTVCSLSVHVHTITAQCGGLQQCVSDSHVFPFLFSNFHSHSRSRTTPCLFPFQRDSDGKMGMRIFPFPVQTFIAIVLIVTRPFADIALRYSVSCLDQSRSSTVKQKLAALNNLTGPWSASLPP